jgi:hypothetical protein
MKYQVLHNGKPADRFNFPGVVQGTKLSIWDNSIFQTLPEARHYLKTWCGLWVVNADNIFVNTKYFLAADDGDVVEIIEVL